MGTVAIQRGHCFRTRGATGGPYEQETVAEIARLAVPLLREVGHTPTLLTADEQVPRTDVFIALHTDASGSPAASGASVGYRNADGKKLAHAWKSAYRAHGWDRGWQRDNYTANLARYYGTGRALAAGTRWACIVEHGFTTHPVEQKILRSAVGRRRAAFALRDAVIAVIGGRLPEYRLGDRLIGRGDRGTDVRDWQELVNERRRHADPLAADGIFGPNTDAATKAIQRAVGVTADGIVGPVTLDAVESFAGDRHVPDHDLEVTIRWQAPPDEGAARVLQAAWGFRAVHADDDVASLVRVAVGYDDPDADTRIVGVDRDRTAALVLRATRDTATRERLWTEGRRRAGRVAQ